MQTRSLNHLFCRARCVSVLFFLSLFFVRYFISSAVFFGVLVVLAGYYIHQLHTLRGRASQARAGTSKREVAVTSLVFLIFLSRCIFDMLGAFDQEGGIFRHNIAEEKQTHTKLLEGEEYTCTHRERERKRGAGRGGRERAAYLFSIIRFCLVASVLVVFLCQVPPSVCCFSGRLFPPSP